MFQKRIKFSTYSVLTVLNYIACNYLTGFQSLLYFSITLAGVLVNHAALVYSVNIMLSHTVRRSKFAAILLNLKLFSLVFVLYVALSYDVNNLPYYLMFYTFQLIILVISNKRETKKIKDI